MLKREVLPRSFVSALCAVFVCLALTALPGVVPAEVRAAMSDEAFVELCGNGTVEQVKQALKDGANPNARGETGMGVKTALARATWNGNEANGPDGEAGLPVIQVLLAAGADPNGRNEDGVTALMEASSGAVVKALLDAGADLKARDNAGETALMHAAESGWDGSLEALLAAGAEVNVQDTHGGTALMRAALHGKVGMVRALLAAGADPKIKDKDGHDALWHARQSPEIAGTTKRDVDELVRLLEGGAKKPAAKKAR